MAKELTEAVKRAHRQYPTGVTIVTTLVEGVPYGLAVNAFSSVSLDPPSVLVCVAESSATHPRLMACERLAVNVLAYDQQAIVERFARSGGDKFAGLPWQPGPDGCPILDGVSAYFELQVSQRLPASTHTIILGTVTSAEASSTPPLVYLGGKTFDSSALGLGPEEVRA